MTAPGDCIWLGVDLGTQGCRVAAIDDTGRRLAFSVVPFRSSRPHVGWHEQDPMAWTAAIASACREVLGTAGRRMVAAVAVCATSGTVLVADKSGRPLTPALMYDDSRGAAYTRKITTAWERCGTRNGYRVQPTWALPKLAWILRHVADSDRGRLYHASDFVEGWLVGEPVATDTSHALKTGYDLVRQEWPVDAFEAAGLPMGVLPRVVRPGVQVGVVGTVAAQASGLAIGTPVIAGMTDGCASQIASGAVRPGQWNCALGTTFVLKGVSSELLHDPDGAIYSHRHPDDGWLPGGASNSGAGVLTATFPDAKPAEMDRLAKPYVPTDVVCYPISKRGERFPFVCPDAEGFQLGKPANDAEHFAALLQGVACVERLSLACVRSLGAETEGDLAFTGGATASQFWNQLRADVLGRPVRLPRYPDAAIGMAILAAKGPDTLATAVDRMVAIKETIEPRERHAARYDAVYRRFVDELARRDYIGADLAAQARAA